VTTKAEFDAALGSADQVIVEGDDELSSYAVSKAAGDPANRIDIPASTTEIQSPTSADISFLDPALFADNKPANPEKLPGACCNRVRVKRRSCV
jgi:hypothetical protein